MANRPILIGQYIVTLMDYTCIPQIFYIYYLNIFEGLNQLVDFFIAQHIVTVYEQNIK